jgi:hypothetical protein
MFFYFFGLEFVTERGGLRSVEEMEGNIRGRGLGRGLPVLKADRSGMGCGFSRALGERGSPILGELLLKGSAGAEPSWEWEISNLNRY